jgi:hypothetical protein
VEVEPALVQRDPEPVRDRLPVGVGGSEVVTRVGHA